MASDSQNRANRENAQLSTGPRSPEGKHTSSTNSLRHGIYASGTTAIPAGHFAEDQVELDSFIVYIVAALDPRDGLEQAQAERIAVYYLQLRRLNRFEAEALVGVTADLTDEERLLHNIAGRSLPPDQKVLSALAGDAVGTVLERASRIDARIGRALDQALVIYYELQKREVKPGLKSLGPASSDR